MAEFNLIDESWIPCIDPAGKHVEYGIRDTLLKAHELREICDDSPLVAVAIHRLLLAILYRAYQGPSDTAKWKSLYRTGHFTPSGALAKYLKEWNDRFCLFDDKYPFMQVAGLDLNEYKQGGAVKKDKSDGLMRLVREAPDKGGRVLFDHRVGTERPEYEPKQIARMLLAAQSCAGTGVASGGMVGNQRIAPTPCQFAPCVDGVCLWLQAENLFQTLLLNLVPRDSVADDKPSWEDDSILGLAIRSWKKPIAFAGPVQRFAPLSRLVRVVDRRSMFFTNGVKSESDSDDPMKAYSRSGDKQAYQAVKLREGKAAWRDSHVLFSLDPTTGKPPLSLNHFARLAADGTLPKSPHPRANVVGLATDQGKSLLWRHDRMPVPVGILECVDLAKRLGQLISEAEGVAADLSRGLFWNATTKKTIRTEPVGRIQAIADLMLTPSLELKGKGILRNPSGRRPDDAHNKSALDLSKSLDPCPVYWARLEAHFFSLLENLPKDWDDVTGDPKPDDQQTATRTWREHVRREARQALEETIRSLGTTSRAIQAAARVRTEFTDHDLRPPPPKAAKAKKKGARKK